MARAAAKKKQPAKSLEQRLWDAADALRGNQEPSEYKHVVLGLVFPKVHLRPVHLPPHRTRSRTPRRRHPRRPPRRFPRSPRRIRLPQRLLGPCRRPLGHHPSLRRSLHHRHRHRYRHGPHREGEPGHPRCPAAQLRPRGPGQGRLGQLVDLIGSIGFTEADDHGIPTTSWPAYEYFSAQLPARDRQGRRRLLHPAQRRQPSWRCSNPFHGPRHHDPACGSGACSSNPPPCHRPRRQHQHHLRLRPGIHRHPWRLAKMNLALRGIEADLGNVPPTPSPKTCTPTFVPTSSWPTRRSTCPTGGTPNSPTTRAGSTALPDRQRQPPGSSTSSTT